MGNHFYQDTPCGCFPNAINEEQLSGTCGPHHPPYTGHHHHHCQPECPEPTIVPPPIPPVRYIPGMNVQEQLCNMAERVNVAVDRWNHIQADCYRALDQVVGAAVNNDVYYSSCEVKYSKGYSEEAACEYSLVEAKAVDSAGRPIFCRLRPAFNNTTNSGARELITQASFVTSAQMCITAVQASESFWAGDSLFNCNPGAGAPDDTVWICGWTRNGVLRFFRGDVGQEVLRQNRMVDCIGPVFPVLKDGQFFEEVVGSMGEEKGSIQAIGWKKMNGNKVFLSCGAYDQPGMSPQAVAKILQGMGCTTAVITSYQTAPVGAYDSTPIGAGTIELSGTNPGNTGAVEVPGMTGGMTFVGKLTDAPLQWSIPSNVAVWVISKRPPRGWRNAFTTEVADVVQKLGNVDNTLSSIMGQINGGNQDIAQLKNQVQKNTNDIANINAIVGTFDERLEDVEASTAVLEVDVATLKTQVSTLDSRLTSETAERKAADAALDAKIATETSQRIAEDTLIRSELAQETADRQAADAALKVEITQESQTRAEADRNLQAAIEAEQSARATKDTQHEARMDALEAQEEKDFAAVQEELDKIKDGSSLPIATTEQLGVIKVGRNLTVEEDGTLNATGGGSGQAFEVIAGNGITVEKDTDTGDVTVSANIEQIIVDTGIDDVQTDIDRISGELDAVKEKDTAQDTAIAENTQKNTVQDTAIQANTQKNTEQDTAIGELQQSDSAQDTEIAGLKEKNEEQDGRIEALENKSFTLEPATTEKLGGVIVGNGLDVNTDGNLSVALPSREVTKAEYEALSEELKGSDTLWVVPDGGGGVWPTPPSGGAGFDLSETESVVGTFMGKTMYSRVVTGTVPNLPSSNPVYHQIIMGNEAEIDKVIYIHGYVDSWYMLFPIPYSAAHSAKMNSTLEITTAYSVQGNMPHIFISFFAALVEHRDMLKNMPFYLTVFYTKKES